MYRDKICKILENTYNLVPDALPKNQDILDMHLSQTSGCFTKIDLILRGQNFPPPPGGVIDQVLVSKIQPYLDAEEARMSKNLECLDYNLDSMDAVASVTGPGRIEKVSPTIPLIFRHITRLIVPISIAILAAQT
jgi:hypothetical protein